MKNKERLLDHKEPVRFIFSHSALREGWDNPNVFQICTLKQSGSDVRKRQEVGRGLRLSVNQSGERMDANLLGDDVHHINVLTVIANESYDSFAKGLQNEIAEAVADRPRRITADLFNNKIVRDTSGQEQFIDIDLADAIYEGLIHSGYISKGELTDKYREDKANGTIEIAEEASDFKDDVIRILDSVYDAKAMLPDDARGYNVELKLDTCKLESKEFQALWSRINAKSAYVVEFDEEELIKNTIKALNLELRVSKVIFEMQAGSMGDIQSKEQLHSGQAFVREKSKTYKAEVTSNTAVKYDLIGKLIEETGLTRKTAVQILRGIEQSVFSQFQDNPEEFIIRAAEIINEQKATVIIQHITYDKLESTFDTSIFTEPTIRGRLGVNAIRTQKHLYDHVVFDSTNEKVFAENIDISDEVAVYAKLPSGFYINTPIGKYNPDWAIVFHEGKVKHIYFVAETKGSMSSMQIRKIENAKIDCAREHFKAISTNMVVYDVVDSYAELMKIVMGKE